MKKKLLYSLLGVYLVGIVGIIAYIFSTVSSVKEYNNNDYYKKYIHKQISLTETEDQPEEETETNFETVIDHTIKFTNQSLNTKDDAIKLITTTAENEESKCTNDLSEIEEELKEKTNIYGINFCELDEQLAQELNTMIQKLFETYPIFKGYVTNITLVNDGGQSSYIAAFKPSYTFATSNTSNTFPFSIKIQVYLNSAYFLDNDFFESVIDNSITSNHFPEDTTPVSLVAHEFGHVLTYILDIKYHNSVNTILLKYDDFKLYSETLREFTSSEFCKLIVDEAYKKFRSKETEEQFRLNISGYANADDGNGNTLYNETVAEAFHDYYLHESEAKEESLEIMKVLENYIKKYS